MSCTAKGSELARTVEALISPGKGILAADESTGTAGKRLESVGLPNTEDNRRALRELLFTADGVEKFISGVILYEETLFQASSKGTPLTKELADRGIVPGIKVDIGTVALVGSPRELYTQGLDNLRQRCDKYYAAGARFAKWRAVITIDTAAGLPSPAGVRSAAAGLAAYAKVCQEAGLVPIVEPEVLADGPHGIDDCEAVTHEVLSVVFRELAIAKVQLETILLKPNMIVPGSKGPAATPDAVAAATLRVLRRTVPPAVPGIMFLSGGQSEEEATKHLELINKLGGSPWYVSFSYGRALQASALKAWSGDAANAAAAQAVFIQRAEANSQAALAK
ncbi:fructose-bisphosphate aldolase, class I [Monoraphidium neglectum]|uniref:fructose-bisphosphate aldolase n=1 Tax=Monoraphidium neglectum TaxID=145388 RepID=A0A0D2MU39_9CHLO|nr:fructose-bisphosphate aldolase, class I [Monoraphidium neglectum]KIZ04032.1 fructose-bisphosphate aldolase, class I [Monoraphidium neglectum]|eukprot:XP_013903051.1 fructose-bisphosphate aldolase, class I [Monoraphidium neglectum]